MRAAYDDIERVITALLQSEIIAKSARPINYRMGLAKFPLAKELADLDVAWGSVRGTGSRLTSR